MFRIDAGSGVPVYRQLIEQVRRAGIPAVAFVHDEWLVYGPRVDRWTRLFAGRPWLGGLARRLTGVP